MAISISTSEDNLIFSLGSKSRLSGKIIFKIQLTCSLTRIYFLVHPHLTPLDA